ncbi:uncharacterized protein LOC113324461 [Papaver somniferum]|uniref:uncharacterized protein LOC113324461 n=1 Tax=Papaver somniferum TaxID=3469 RepID=UPI000E6FC71C|nr:uncharacterized protein LOC113324461 [Papaver somniferum]
METVDQLMVPNSNTWNIDMLNVLFDSNIVNEICKIRIPLNGADRLIWKPADNGLFSVKTAYRVVDEVTNVTTSSDPPLNFPWKLFWKLDLPQIILHFLWKCVHKCLPVRDRIARYMHNVDTIFPLCHREVESINHLFLDCHVTKLIWDATEIPNLDTTIGQDMTDWITSWLTINNVFDNIQIQINATVQQIKKSILEWNEHLAKVKANKIQVQSGRIAVQ